jgi:hypothetical protein
LIFHFSEEQIGEQLVKVNDRSVRFVSSEGPSNAGVYYEVADLCTLAVFYGPSLGIEVLGGPVPEQLAAPVAERLQGAVNLALRFMTAAETFILTVLKAEGCKLQSVFAP